MPARRARSREPGAQCLVSLAIASQSGACCNGPRIGVRLVENALVARHPGPKRAREIVPFQTCSSTKPCMQTSPFISFSAMRCGNFSSTQYSIGSVGIVGGSCGIGARSGFSPWNYCSLYSNKKIIKEKKRTETQCKCPMLDLKLFLLNRTHVKIILAIRNCARIILAKRT